MHFLLSLRGALFFRQVINRGSRKRDDVKEQVPLSAINLAVRATAPAPHRHASIFASAFRLTMRRRPIIPLQITRTHSPNAKHDARCHRDFASAPIPFVGFSRAVMCVRFHTSPR